MRKGMTLLEVLIAMLLLGLIVSSMLATFSIVGKGSGKLGILELQAVNYARETLERLKNAVSEDPTRSAGLVDSDPAPAKGTTYVDPLPDGDFKNLYGGTRTYDVMDVDADNPKDGIIDYKKVTVTVTWND